MHARSGAEDVSVLYFGVAVEGADLAARSQAAHIVGGSAVGQMLLMHIDARVKGFCCTAQRLEADRGGNVCGLHCGDAVVQRRDAQCSGTDAAV